ncbi:ABC transporter ATP-binding protein [Nocardioides limicola]|uniref:ABC transporter ATP-binding protein n=1 Tax=Nocardioides limicola TaxID=2803368 RepID=UPI00193C85B0|nr:ABC transporter ATP-binding protein [Nocardioides sp. DJM-14]
MGTTLTARVRRHLLDLDLSVDVEQAPVTVVFGPSGSGKTTLLRCLAGLDRPESGSRIEYDGALWCDDSTWVRARDRRIGLLFQDHVLFPHLSVAGNVGYGLRQLPRADRPARIREALAAAGAEHLIDRAVPQLSGGEAQRVALARALAPRPRLLLLDEPLSALDTPTRARLRGELRRLLREAGVPALVVTHDRAEALALGDRVAVLIDGRLRQFDDVATVFSAPADLAVADAVGTETIVAGQVVDTDQGVTRVQVRGHLLHAVTAEPLPEGSPVLACVRAEDVALHLGAAESGGSPRNHLAAVVTGLDDHGPLLRVDLDAGFALAAYVTRPTREDLGLTPGLRVTAVIKAPAVHLVPRGTT